MATNCPFGRKSLEEQQLGKLFLETAPEMRIKLRHYCEQHCDLIELLNSEKTQIERLLAQNSTKTDLKAIVLGLSLVFRHIQKYAGLLQEIERNTPVWGKPLEANGFWFVFCRKPIQTGAICNERSKCVWTFTLVYNCFENDQILRRNAK